MQTAERQVAAMRAEVERTARALTDGTRRLEQEQAALAGVQQRLAVAEREAAEAGAASTAARSRLRTVVGAAYRSPLPSALALALSTGPDGLGDALSAQGDLERVRGRQQDLLAEALTQRVRAAGAVRTVEQLTGDAARRTQDLQARTADLRAQAGATAARLAQASARLASARASRAAVRAVAASCRGGARPAANGFLDRDALCRLTGTSGALRADAATAFNRMSEAHRAERGSLLCVTDSYRSYAAQVSVYRRKPQLAAVPGTSLHGLGIAVDLGCGVQRFGSSSYRWMKANAGRFGWVHPSWAEPGGSMPEPWHWEYRGR